MEAPNLEHDDNRISQVQNIDWRLFGFQWGAMVLSRDQLGLPA